MWALEHLFKSRQIYIMRYPTTAATTATIIPAITSLIKCTPETTRTTARAIDTNRKITPNQLHGEINKNVIAIIVAEKTCLLGNDCPFVSFFITGGTSNVSYGLGLFIHLRNKDKSTKLIPGTSNALVKLK